MDITVCEPVTGKDKLGMLLIIISWCSVTIILMFIV